MDDERPQFTRLKGAVGNVSGMLRLKRLGKIRLGMKKKSASTGAEYPAETDYFVCPPEVQAVYGPEPKVLEGLFLSNNPEEIYQEKLALYGRNSGLKCHGNGEVAMRRDEQGKWVERKCPCEFLKTTENPKGECGPQAHFMVMLPKVEGGLWGYYQITTRSVNSRVSILRDLQQMQQMLGKIANVPILLTRVPQEITYQGSKKVHYVISFRPAMDIDAVREFLADSKNLVVPDLVQIEQPLDENPLLDPVDVVVEDTEEGMRDDEITAVQEALRAREAERALPPLTGPPEPKPKPEPAPKPLKPPVARKKPTEKLPESLTRVLRAHSLWVEFIQRIDEDEVLSELKRIVKHDMSITDLRQVTDSEKQAFLENMQHRCMIAGVPLV